MSSRSLFRFLTAGFIAVFCFLHSHDIIYAQGIEPKKKMQPEAKVNAVVGANYLLVSRKYYPAVRGGIYFYYFGFSIDLGLIRSQDGFEAFGNTTRLGYFYDVSVLTRIKPLKSVKRFTLEPGFTYAVHHLTSIADDINYKIASLSIAFYYYLFDKVELSYQVRYPVDNPSQVVFDSPKLLGSVGLSYRFNLDDE